MRFYIHQNVLGSKAHLCVADGEFSWVNRIPNDEWQLGDKGRSRKSIDELAQLYKNEITGFDKIPEYVFFQELGMKPPEIEWHSVLTKERYQHILKTVIDDAQSSLEFSETDHYLNTFLKSRDALAALERAHINLPLLQRKMIMESGATQKSNLNSFMPDQTGFAKKSNYNQFSTATGRLTIKGGPQILTLAKHHRDIIDSRWGKDGKIMYTDFISLEPRVALMRLEIDPGQDVYEFVNKQCLGGNLSRAQSKISTLGALYGMSVQTFGGKSSAGKKELASVKKLFQIKTLSAELDEEWNDTGKIMNLFGRMIIPNNGASHILVNGWLQSSAVDVSLLGFHNLISKMSHLRAIPLFYIHDACIFDVHCDDLEEFKTIVNNGTIITGLGRFPLTCNGLEDGD